MDEETWQRYLARIAQKNQIRTVNRGPVWKNPPPGWMEEPYGPANPYPRGPGGVYRPGQGGVDTDQIITMAKKLQRENPELVEQVRQNVDPATLAGQLEDMGIRPQEVTGQFQPYKRPLPPGQGDWTGGTDPDRYMPYPRWRRPYHQLRPEDAYMRYVSKQEGWNPEWDQYSDQLARYLRDPSVDVTKEYTLDDGTIYPQGVAVNRAAYPGIPQDVWSDISKWYEAPKPATTNNPESIFKRWDKFKSDYFQRPRPYPYPRWRRPPEDEYMRYLSKQEGWNPDWDRYAKRLKTFLRSGGEHDVSEQLAYPTYMVEGPGGKMVNYADLYGVGEAIPQDVWSDIAKWYEGKRDAPESGDPYPGKFKNWDKFKGDYFQRPRPYPYPPRPPWNPSGRPPDGLEFPLEDPGGPTPPAPIGRLPIEAQYLNYAKRQKGWNPEWDRYSSILHDYLRGDRKDVTEPQLPDPDMTQYGPPKSRGPSHIPQADWAQMTEFAKGLKPMSGDEWRYKEENIIPWRPGPYEEITLVDPYQGGEMDPWMRKKLISGLTGPGEG